MDSAHRDKEVGRPAKLDRNCCGECFSDYAIKAFITNKADIGHCDFCNSTSVPIIDTADLAIFIDEGIDRKYEGAEQHLLYESAEGGFQEELLSTSDILEAEEVFNTDLLEDPTSLADDLAAESKYATPTLVRQDPYGDPSGAFRHMSMWESFCRQVKHLSRYTFFEGYSDYVRARRNGEYPSPPRDGDPFHPFALWYDVNESLPETMRMIQENTQIFRARISEGPPFGHEQMTSPPTKSTRDNRMSPRGVSYFYGAFDIETAVAEVRPYLGAHLSVAEFTTNTHAYIFDLTTLPSIKSIFDGDYFDFKNDVFFKPFLREFAREISRPIAPGDESLEYVPAQVFCEFLRLLGREAPIQGLKYWSAMRKGGTCVAFFRGSDISLGPNPWLHWKSSFVTVVEEINLKIYEPEQGFAEYLKELEEVDLDQ